MGTKFASGRLQHIMFVSRIPSLTARRQIVQIPPISSLPFCPFSQSLRGNDSQKDSQDKDTINTETTEYSKSGTDDSAAHEKVAFDPKTTSPEQEKIDAGKENKVSIQAAECGVFCLHILRGIVRQC